MTGHNIFKIYNEVFNSQINNFRAKKSRFLKKGNMSVSTLIVLNSQCQDFPLHRKKYFFVKHLPRAI